MTSGDTKLGPYRGFDMTAHQSRKGSWQGCAEIAGHRIEVAAGAERITFFVEDASPHRVAALLRERVDRWHLTSDL